MAVTGSDSHIQASRYADPCRVADATLAAPGISRVARGPDEIHQISDDPWTAAASLGLIGFTPALETP
jgi:hypothetical protein